MMEPDQRTVKLGCSAHLMIAVVVFYQIYNVDSSLPAQTYNTSDGRLCYKCAPGQYWVADCIGSGEVARCLPCAKGSFQTVESIARTCKQCTKYCTQEIQEFIKACTSTTDNICQCPSGYYMIDIEGRCVQHRKCASGQGVKSPGNKDRDTICENCTAGDNFSSNASATEGCLPCTKCDVKGLVEVSPCTVKSDAHCVRSKPPDESLSTGAIVGVIVGVLVFIAITAFVWYFRCFKRRQQASHSPKDGETPDLVEESSHPMLNRVNSSPAPVESINVEYTGQVPGSIDDVMEHGQSNGVRPDSTSSTHSASSQKGMSSFVLTELSKDLVSPMWKFFFRAFSVEDSSIERVEMDNPGNVVEQIYQILLNQNQKGALTKRTIIDALEDIDRNDLAVKYKKIL